MIELLGKKNVVGVAHGEKWTNGKPTGQEAVLVFVDHKEPVENLDPSDIIPKEYDGALTDVVGKSGQMRAMPARQWTSRGPRYSTTESIITGKAAAKIIKARATAKTRPIIGGISIGHPLITAGTLGGLFRDRDNQVVILSNNHVMANSNTSRIGDPIYQPGPYDSRVCDTIATLKDFVQLANGVDQDSAIARVLAPYTPTINYIGKPVGFSTVRLKQAVCKSGRTTLKTSGVVIGTGGVFTIWYSDTQKYIINNCIITRNMCQGGDSGSLLMDSNNRVVGLLFAGSDTITLHSPIGSIVTRYGLKIIN